MDAFVVSARKYRPGTFETVVGQEAIVGTLRNALKLRQLAHAFLFCGPRGVGKTTCARILAKAVNCSNLTEAGDPCNECESCRNFNEGRSLNIFELDAASNNSVDDIRQLIEQVRYVPQSGKRSVYIIDEVHMLTTAAFNAFLKTLEEPPEHAIFILATTEKHKILPTILSRCQKFDFKRIETAAIVGALQDICNKENITAEAKALHLVARKADGGMRDALSIFDQMVNVGRRNVTYKLVCDNLHVLDAEVYFRLGDAIRNSDHGTALLLLDEVLQQGFDTYNFTVGLLEHLRNLLVVQQAQTARLLDVPDDVLAQYSEAARQLPPTALLLAFQLTAESEQKYRSTSNPRLHTELMLIKLCHVQAAITVATNAGSGDEKKKPEPHAVGAPAVGGAGPTPLEAGAPPTPLAAPAAARPTPRKSPALPTDLKSIDRLAIPKEKAVVATEDEPEGPPIDTQAVTQALPALLTHFQQQSAALGAAVKNCKHQIEGNTLHLVATNEITSRQLQDEHARLLAFLREQSRQPQLRLRITFDATLQELEAPQRPLSPHEIKAEMEQKNPHFRLFQETFKTNI